ncbi:MAG: guanitoxin biosynthesis heme-dependent pre-guanitoxin N-hydroxylase GntA [Luteimonas sp.]
MASRFSATTNIVREFQARIEDPEFPCVGAKAAAAQHNLEFELAGDLRSSHADERLVGCLQAFAAAAPADAVFVSKLVLFPSTPRLHEAQFEQALWNRLGALHAIDATRHTWDPSVSCDPESPRFSMSIGGRAFYVIGLHPDASRPARRFHCAALVFNLHSQFETLRDDGRYEKLRETITERDIAYSGSRNPMLATHGVASEARQYSGRQVDHTWRCPFSASTGAPAPARNDGA